MPSFSPAAGGEGTAASSHLPLSPPAQLCLWLQPPASTALLSSGWAAVHRQSREGSRLRGIRETPSKEGGGQKNLERWRLERETKEDSHHHHHLAGTHGLLMRLCSKVACVEAAQWKGLAFKSGCLGGFRRLSFRLHRTPACSRASLVLGTHHEHRGLLGAYYDSYTVHECRKVETVSCSPSMTPLRHNIIYLGPFRETWSSFPILYIHISGEVHEEWELYHSLPQVLPKGTTKSFKRSPSNHLPPQHPYFSCK